MEDKKFDLAALHRNEITGEYEKFDDKDAEKEQGKSIKKVFYENEPFVDEII